jgi:hypothetical protein
MNLLSNRAATVREKCNRIPLPDGRGSDLALTSQVPKVFGIRSFGESAPGSIGVS